MSEGPFIAFYPSDWLAGTRGLTAAETGVYITLVAMMYERGEALAHDNARLARLCGLPKASFERALDTLIAEKKIMRTEAGLWQKRVSDELKRRQNIRDTASKAARSRWEKNQQNQRDDDADAMRTQCGNDANQNQNQSNIDISYEISVIPTDEVSEAVTAYNAAADRAGWPKVQKLSPARRSALKARLKDAGGLGGWRVALEKAEASDFLCARTPQAFAASFDFLTRQSSFAKVMEGNYDNRAGNSGAASGSGTGDAFAAVAARLEREAGSGYGR